MQDREVPGLQAGALRFSRSGEIIENLQLQVQNHKKKILHCFLNGFCGKKYQWHKIVSPQYKFFIVSLLCFVGLMCPNILTRYVGARR